VNNGEYPEFIETYEWDEERQDYFLIKRVSVDADSRALLRLADEQGILSYSRLLDCLDAGGESLRELNQMARTRQNRQLLWAYFESKRRIKGRKRDET
jgi:hypothetical protein